MAGHWTSSPVPGNPKGIMFQTCTKCAELEAAVDAVLTELN
jgi:hypothetical protein